jgi:hypothetical protein
MAIGERLYWDEYSGFVADYRLTNYLERLGPVGGATLTDAGRDLLEAYTIRREGARCTVVRRGLCVFLPEGESLPWHPLHTALDPRKPDLDWLDHPIFKPQGKEERSLTDIPLAVLGRSVASAQVRDPQRVDRFFRELREEFDAVRGTLQEGEFARALPPLEANLPAELWQFYFGDIDPTPVDLVAQRLEMSPPGASAGQKVVFSVQVSNRGKGTAAPFKVRLEIDGTGVELSVPGLAPGVAITVASPPWTATLGKHTVRGIADASARIAEPVEDDNVLERRFVVRRTAGGLPDLRPLSVRLKPSPPRAGEPLVIVARVRNTGGNALDAFAVRFVIDGATIGEATVPGLPARELVEVRSPSWTAVPGGHALQVIVDAGQAVVEADEGNNAHARSFRVTPGRH